MLSHMKTIEQYTYNTFDTIGKGYSSQVYKGKNDRTSNFFVIHFRLVSSNQAHRPQVY